MQKYNFPSIQNYFEEWERVREGKNVVESATNYSQSTYVSNHTKLLKVKPFPSHLKSIPFAEIFNALKYKAISHTFISEHVYSSYEKKEKTLTVIIIKHRTNVLKCFPFEFSVYNWLYLSLSWICWWDRMNVETNVACFSFFIAINQISGVYSNTEWK